MSVDRSRPISVCAVGPAPVAEVSMSEAVDHVISSAVARRSVAYRFVNAYSVACTRKDSAYAALLADSGVNFADGRPVLWVQMLRGARRAGQVRGPSAFRLALDRGRERDISHYFFGCTEEVLEALVAQARAIYPGVRIAGAFAPPFGPVDDLLVDDATARIEAADPDIVWVALGTPKQDFAAAALAAATGRPCAAVGAAFDFLAGSTPEAPHWVRRVGMEWLYRMLADPVRLWRRYTIGNLQFLLAVVTGRRP
ncbi:UNVERIFIED_ORG: N-acetylglucosaminyldiphosphoundecaprenol N-acetyl-beta-D-mannosaminyltransferase [Gordonia westfalica J30]